jgi:hypothetical protein
MWITSGGPGIGEMDSYVLGSPSLNGLFTLVAFLPSSRRQAYFLSPDPPMDCLTGQGPRHRPSLQQGAPPIEGLPTLMSPNAPVALALSWPFMLGVVALSA